MKILTAEEEAAHNKAVWTGGVLGGLGGLALGVAGVAAATTRSAAFRQLSVPFRVFLAMTGGTFGAVVTADRYSHAFEKSRHADSDYVNRNERELKEAEKQEGVWQRTTKFVSEQRYPIVVGSWVASMAIAFGIVSRQKYLTPQQKLVQARVYAQGLTLAVLVASFGLEGNDLRSGKGRWETIKVVDPNDPEHKRMIDKRIHHEAYSGEDQWMDMIEAQERKMKDKGRSTHSGKNAKDSSSDKNNEASNTSAESEATRKKTSKQADSKDPTSENDGQKPKSEQTATKKKDKAQA